MHSQHCPKSKRKGIANTYPAPFRKSRIIKKRIISRVDHLLRNFYFSCGRASRVQAIRRGKRIVTNRLVVCQVHSCPCLRHMYEAKSGSVIYVGSVHSKEAPSRYLVSGLIPQNTSPVPPSRGCRPTFGGAIFACVWF
jgi:hypothetical protein